MTFDAPAGLLLLAALPIILWLHLRKRWPRKVTVPSLTPWLVLRRASTPRRRRIPPTVLLALHLLAATAIAVAAAGPRLPGRPTDVLDRAVVLDVSSSMAASDRWAEARAEARALLGSVRGQATLVTLGPRPRVVIARDQGGGTAQAALQDLALGGTGADTDGALRLASAVAGPDADLVVVSDGGVPAPGPESPAARWVLVGEPEDNVAVVDAAARSVGGELRLFARVAGFAADTRMVPLTVRVDDRAWDERVVALPPGETVELVWTLSADARTAEVGLDGRDALAADDRAVVPLDGGGVRVQLIGDGQSAVARALEAMPHVRLDRAGLGSYRTDGTVDVSVFVGAMPDALPPGGVVLFDPPAGPLIDVQTSGASAMVDTVGDHAIVTGLDLSGTVLSNLSHPRVPQWAELVLAAESRTAVFAGSLDLTRIVVMAFDPAAGVLSERLAFPLLVARAVDWAAPGLPPAAVDAGARVVLPPAEFRVRSPDGSSDTVAGVFESTGQPGIYVAQAQAPGARRAVRFAVHAGDVVESDLRVVEAPATGTADGRGRPATRGRALWPVLAALAVLALLVETVWRAWPRAAAAGGRPA